jgi:SAM-dependent methyltransferase
MLTDLQYGILMGFFSRSPQRWNESVYQGKSKLDILFGDKFLGSVAGKTVIDFGCGEGLEVIDIAKRGARRVIGVDSREGILQTARGNAAAAGVGSSCLFATSTKEFADLVISVDAFEHFDRPAEILDIMNKLLRPGGEVLVSFGPTWYHPLGGHLFSVFPWAHLLFSETALIRWRSTFKTDGATCFSEVEGGLNQMTIRKFERLVEGSPFSLATLDLVPIRKLAPLHNRLTREFTTAVVRCRLRKRDR